MALGITLVAFGRMRPNLNALPCQRRAVACAQDLAGHPEAAPADPVNHRRAGAVIVGPAAHGGRWRHALSMGAPCKARNARYRDALRQQGPAGKQML